MEMIKMKLYTYVYPDINKYLLVFVENHSKGDTLVLLCPELLK